MKSTSSSHNTFYVIAYDIPDDRRRTKIHKILSGFGTWTQYSLFECFLSRKELVQLKAKLAKHLEETQDSLRFYPLCVNCVEKVETVGGSPRTKIFCISFKSNPVARGRCGGDVMLSLSQPSSSACHLILEEMGLHASEAKKRSI